MAVIGFDFGNFYSFPSFIMDERAGHVTMRELIPNRLRYGIPSIYFYSSQKGEILGDMADTNNAVPYANRVRYLKRNLGNTKVIDGKEIEYNHMITQVIQYCIRMANSEMNTNWHQTTNEISLAYPASYTPSQIQLLIELAEAATLEDGRHIKVSGTIAEPAAAALDFLAEHTTDKESATVLTYDLGGGTFDIALVSAYPNGRQNNAGQTYYYDVLNHRGIPDLGGKEFDEVINNIVRSKVDGDISPAAADAIMRGSVKAKEELTGSENSIVTFFRNEAEEFIDITRAEFEAAAKPLIDRTVEMVREMLEDNRAQSPDYILLTGGASQMPMVRAAIEEAFPEYKDRIELFRPHLSISYGAARFGQATPNVQQYTARDIGIEHIDKSKEGAPRFVHTYIPKHQPLPYNGDFSKCYTASFTDSVIFCVREAIVENPDSYRPSDDYKEIGRMELKIGKAVPENYPLEFKLGIDKLGRLTIEARDPASSNAPVKNTFQLTNLNTD